MDNVYFTQDYPHMHLSRNPGLQQLVPGAYTDASLEPQATAIARIRAVAHKLRAPIVMSHTSAALLHGFYVPQRHLEVVHLYQPWTASARNSAQIIRHTTSKEFETSEIDGITCTDPLRTIIDCARILPPKEALILVDSAFAHIAESSRFQRPQTLERAEVLRARLQEQLGQLTHLRNVRRARAMIRFASPFADSPPESILRLLTLSAGLPQPEVQPLLTLEDQNFFPDLMWRTDAGLVVAEFDGQVKYQTTFGIDPSQAVFDEKQREDVMRRAGITVVRFIYRELSPNSPPMRQLCNLIAAREIDPLVKYLREVPHSAVTAGGSR